MRPLTRTLPALLAIALLACTGPSPDALPASAPAPGLENGSFTAEHGGFRIHYEVHGQGPVLMTLPNSWGLSLEGLRAMYRPLEERLTLVYFDPRGMGGSGAVREDEDRGLAAVRADFQALREHLGLASVHAIGWSNGAVNLVWLAHERPQTLSSAIFVHGMAAFTAEDAKLAQGRFPELWETWADFMKEVADPAKSDAEKTALQRKLWLEEYFPLITADPERAKPMLAEVFAEADFSWPHAEYANREASTFDAREELPHIPTRSLVIAGAHDMHPPEKVKPLHDLLPDSTFVVFEKSGHFAPIEEPEAFQAAVFDFLGVSPPPGAGE